MKQRPLPPICFRAPCNSLRCLVLLGAVGAAVAEVGPDDLPTPPVIVPSNYQRIAVGQFGALEGGAIIARIRGSEGGWYNPAGLTDSRGNLSGSANVLQINNVSIDALGTSEATAGFKVVPSYFGAVAQWGRTSDDEPGTGAISFSVASPNPWSQTFDTRATVDGLEFTYSSLVNTNTVVPALSYGTYVNDRLRLGSGLRCIMRNLSLRLLRQCWY